MLLPIALNLVGWAGVPLGVGLLIDRFLFITQFTVVILYSPVSRRASPLLPSRALARWVHIGRLVIILGNLASFYASTFELGALCRLWLCVLTCLGTLTINMFSSAKKPAGMRLIAVGGFSGDLLQTESVVEVAEFTVRVVWFF